MKFYADTNNPLKPFTAEQAIEFLTNSKPPMYPDDYYFEKNGIIWLRQHYEENGVTLHEDMWITVDPELHPNCTPFSTFKNKE